MASETSESSSDRTRGPVPSALLLAPSKQYGSEEPWYMGVVLQQACQAMVRGGAA